MREQSDEMVYHASAVIDKLRGIGVTIFFRENMHQKVAILDKEIAWEGSLNILSHRDTGENMRRFTGPSIIEDIIRKLRLDEEVDKEKKPSGSAVNPAQIIPCPGNDGSGCKANGHLVLRKNRVKGDTFFGCSAYPKCTYTKPYSNS